MRVPKYRRHSSGQAFIEWHGKRYYLGRHGSLESRKQFKRFLDDNVFPASRLDRPAEKPTIPGALSIDALVLAYLEFAIDYYSPEHYANLEITCEWLSREVGSRRADEFGPLALKELRKRLVAKVEPRLSRSYINGQISIVKRIFSWAVGEELLPAKVADALRHVKGLRKGKTTAKESKPVRPADQAAVDAVIAILPPMVADMVRIQQLTGMRSGELVRMRAGEVDRSRKVWIYSPTKFKGDTIERIRDVPIGPRAQQIMAKYITDNADAFLFSPAASEDQRNAVKRSGRKTPMTPSQANRRRRRLPVTSPGEAYTPKSYRRCISRAIADINAGREADGKQLIEKWFPHQLRHGLATKVRRDYGLEGAQVILGHAKADVTEIYAERDLDLAKRIASELG